jgi:hypothetical protein
MGYLYIVICYLLVQPAILFTDKSVSELMARFGDATKSYRKYLFAPYAFVFILPILLNVIVGRPSEHLGLRMGETVFSAVVISFSSLLATTLYRKQQSFEPAYSAAPIAESDAGTRSGALNVVSFFVTCLFVVGLLIVVALFEMHRRDAQVQVQTQTVSLSEGPPLNPISIQQAIWKEGAKGYASRVRKEGTEWTALLAKISTGSMTWLPIAEDLGSTGDPEVIRELRLTLARALTANPHGTLGFLMNSKYFVPRDVCGVVEIQSSESEKVAFLKRQQESVEAPSTFSNKEILIECDKAIIEALDHYRNQTT